MYKWTQMYTWTQVFYNFYYGSNFRKETEFFLKQLQQLTLNVESKFWEGSLTYHTEEVKKFLLIQVWERSININIWERIARREENNLSFIND